MDKVVERWVTTSKPLESRGLWKRFVQERNQVLPQPKPSKSISDKYQDYLKAESYLEPKSQMFVRDEMGFNKGGRIGFASGTPFPVNDETIEKFRYYIEETDLNKKAIGEKLGFKSTAKGVGGNIRKDSPIVKAYEAKYGKIPEERFKPYKLDIKSPQVQKVLKLHDEGLSTRQITKRLGFKDEKSVRNIFKQFRPEAIQKPNIPGEITSAKKSKIKATENIKIAEKKAGVKTTKQAKDVISQIADYNEPYKNMSATELVKDKKFLDRLRMHIDINTGEVTYDGYTKARPRKGKVFSDLELAEHAIKKAKAGELFTADHITPKSLKKQNVGYPINFQPATYIENSNFDNARKYVLNKPEGDTSAIDKYLTKNNQTLRFPDQKIKLGYKGVIEYNPTKNTHTLVKKGGYNFDSKQLAQGLNKILDCKLAAGVNCDDPMSYYKSLKEQEKIAATGKGANKLKAVSKVRAAKNLLYGTIGPAAVAVEAGIAAPLAGYEFFQGALPSEILNTATYGIAGKDRDEVIQEASSEEIFKPRDFMKTGEKLESLYVDPITGGYRGRYDRTKAIEDTEKKFRDQYYDSYFAHPKTGEFSESIFNLRLKEQQDEEAKYQQQRDQLKQERRDKYTNFSTGYELPEFAGGGIAGVRRPHAIPPKSGPMPQGGGLSSMFNRVRKW